MILPVCSNCGKEYPLERTPYQCSCGGVYDFADFPAYQSDKIMWAEKSLWKYRSMFGLDDNAPIITLGEGNTPLVDLKYGGHPVLAKLEYQNPTGSYKDRGSAILVSFLASRGAKQVVEDSSGNAGASLAAYAARAGLKAKVFVPESASGPKRKQIEYYGAELALISGPRSEAAKAVREAAASGIPYASHAYMPFGLTGIATMAYEIAAALGKEGPGTIVAPVGHGGLLYGLMRGYEALRKAAEVKYEPYYVGVQAAGCAPVFEAFQNHEFTLREPLGSDTIAEGVRVKTPVRGVSILKRMNERKGCILQVTDEELHKAYKEIALKGFFVEPTSALVWATLKDIVGKVPDPIILILTGSGLKTQL